MPLDKVEIVRPFYPGGDFEKFNYPPGCLVLDNPPFSILSQIRRFYHYHGIKYFLFAPSLTLFKSAKELDCTFIVCGFPIVYENGATIPTSFITNLPCDGTRIWCAGELYKRIERAVKITLKTRGQAPLPKYTYPDTVISAALLQKITKQGIEFRVSKSDCVPVERLDAQREKGKTIYGGGFLLSERAAAERAAAGRFALSDREKAIIKNMSLRKA